MTAFAFWFLVVVAAEVGMIFALFYIYFGARVIAEMYSDWRDWKTAVRDEIAYLCEDYKDAP